jgi:hypothetical protein
MVAYSTIVKLGDAFALPGQGAVRAGERADEVEKR